MIASKTVITLCLIYSAIAVESLNILTKRDTPDGTKYALSANINMSDVITQYRGNMFSLIALRTTGVQLVDTAQDSVFKTALQNLNDRVLHLLQSIDNARYGFKDILDVENVNIVALKVILLRDQFQLLEQDLSSFGNDLLNGGFDGLTNNPPSDLISAFENVQQALKVHIASVANFVDIMAAFKNDILNHINTSSGGFGNNIDLDGFSCMSNPLEGSDTESFNRLLDDTNSISDVMIQLNNGNENFNQGLEALISKIHSTDA